LLEHVQPVLTFRSAFLRNFALIRVLCLPFRNFVLTAGRNIEMFDARRSPSRFHAALIGGRENECCGFNTVVKEKQLFERVERYFHESTMLNRATSTLRRPINIRNFWHIAHNLTRIYNL